MSEVSHKLIKGAPNIKLDRLAARGGKNE